MSMGGARVCVLRVIQTHANNKKVQAYLRDRFPHPYTKEDAEWWVNHNLALFEDGQFPTNLAICVDDEVCFSSPFPYTAPSQVY